MLMSSVIGSSKIDQMKDYKKLLIWQKGMDFAAEVYRLAKAMPRNEEYRLTSQMLRAAASTHRA